MQQLLEQIAAAARWDWLSMVTCCQLRCLSWWLIWSDLSSSFCLMVIDSSMGLYGCFLLIGLHGPKTVLSTEPSEDDFNFDGDDFCLILFDFDMFATSHLLADRPRLTRMSGKTYTCPKCFLVRAILDMLGLTETHTIHTWSDITMFQWSESHLKSIVCSESQLNFMKFL